MAKNQFKDFMERIPLTTSSLGNRLVLLSLYGSGHGIKCWDFVVVDGVPVT